MGKQWKQCQTLFFWAPKSLKMVTAAMKLKDAYSLEEKLWQPRQHIKKQRPTFTNKVLSSQSYGFSSSHVWLWELDYKESWVPKNWCFWTVVLEKTFWESLGQQEDHGDSPGKNTGVGCHALLQGIFPTQGLNTGFLHSRQTLYVVIYLLNLNLGN